MAMWKYRLADHHEIPEWNKDKYPFALIEGWWYAVTATGKNFYLYLLSEKPILKDGKWAVVAGSELAYYEEEFDKDGWNLRGTYTAEDWGTDFYGEAIEIIWTNFDFLDEKGNVYCKGSDPIPIYE